MADQFGNYIPGLVSAGKTIATYDNAGSPVGVITPTADVACCVDTLTGNRWEWRDSAWTLMPGTPDSFASFEV